MDLAQGGPPLYPVYLVYRTEHDNPLVDEFIALFREAAAADAPRREV